MEINFYQTTTYDKVIQLHKEIFKENNQSFFESLASRDYYKTFVATQNDTLVAYCIISEIAGEAEIINVATIPSFRNQGVATQLLEYVINTIESKDIFLEVSTTNLSAIELYTKVGFVKYSVRKKYYGNTDAILMKLHKN